MFQLQRIKGGRTMFAASQSNGIVGEWTPNEVRAGQFDEKAVEAVASKWAAKIDSGDSVGRLVVLRGGAVVREVGAELHPGLMPLPDEPADLIASPYIAAAEPVSLPRMNSDHEPTVAVAWFCRPITPERDAYIGSLRDVSAAVAEVVAKNSAAGVVPYQKLRKQLEQHDATAGKKLAAVKELLAKLDAERDAAERDLDAPGLASRLRAIAEQRAQHEADAANIDADRKTLVALMERHRGPADAAIRSATTAVIAARKNELEVAIAAEAAGIAERERAALNEIHNLHLALVGLETADTKVMATAKVREILGAAKPAAA